MKKINNIPNVLYLRSTFDPGGIESLLINLYNYKQNVIVFHLVFLKNGSLINNLKSETNHYYKIFRKKTFDLNVIIKIRSIIIDNNISIIHTHQLIELIYALFLKMFLLKKKIKLYHTLHGYFDRERWWAEFLEKLLIKFTETTFTVSYSAKSILTGKGYSRKKIQVLYNAVRLPPKATDQEWDWFKKTIKYQPSDFIVGMIGSFVWQKDQLTIVKAYNILKNSIPHLKLVFLGKESKLSEDCKSLLEASDINKTVFFIGSIKNASKFLPAFNLFVMSTKLDTFGIVVIEALLNKIPVIASNIEVMKELSKNIYFELFDVFNEKDLANKIEQFYYNRNSYDILKAHKYAIDNFSFNNYINKLYDIYTT